MIDAKQAASVAMSAFMNLAGESRAAEALLEEIELAQDDGTAYWAVTLSVPAGYSGLANLAGAATAKDCKLLRIDAESGMFISMKIRKI